MFWYIHTCRSSIFRGVCVCVCVFPTPPKRGCFFFPSRVLASENQSFSIQCVFLNKVGAKSWLVVSNVFDFYQFDQCFSDGEKLVPLELELVTGCGCSQCPLGRFWSVTGGRGSCRFLCFWKSWFWVTWILNVRVPANGNSDIDDLGSDVIFYTCICTYMYTHVHT